jgi:hypothetical protein
LKLGAVPAGHGEQTAEPGAANLPSALWLKQPLAAHVVAPTAQVQPPGHCVHAARPLPSA